MENKIAILGIIVEDKSSVKPVNDLLHQYSQYIIGRMGLPYEKKQVNVISVVLDAPDKIISSLSGKIGKLSGISVKAMMTKSSIKS